MYTNIDYNTHGAIPLLFISPYWILLLPFRIPLTHLETLLAVTGSVHLGLRLLVNWPPLSQPFPQSLPPPNSQNPGFQAPHYDDLKNPASSVRNTQNVSTNSNWIFYPLASKLLNKSFSVPEAGAYLVNFSTMAAQHCLLWNITVLHRCEDRNRFLE